MMVTTMMEMMMMMIMNMMLMMNDNDDDLQIGRGRTTNAMVVACLVKEIQITTELKYNHHDDCQHDDDNQNCPDHGLQKEAF